MGRKLDYHELNEFFDRGEDFSLTDVEYAERVGKNLPKSTSYIMKSFPLAKKRPIMGTSLKSPIFPWFKERFDLSKNKTERTIY